MVYPGLLEFLCVSGSRSARFVYTLCLCDLYIQQLWLRFVAWDTFYLGETTKGSIFGCDSLFPLSTLANPGYVGYSWLMRRFRLHSGQVLGLNRRFSSSNILPQTRHLAKIGGLGSRSCKRFSISALTSESSSVFNASFKSRLASSILLLPNLLENTLDDLPFVPMCFGSMQTKFAG